MGATYLDSGIKIDNWYNDKPPYTGKAVTSLQLNGKCSLVASYEASPVRIEIDANGGVGGSGSQTVQKGETVTLEAPTKEGHLFTGWKDEKGNSYPAGADGKVNITVTEDMTLTAEWKKLPSALVRIEIDANGGVGGSGSQTVQKGETVTLEAPTKEGYLFTGWKDEKGNSYPAGADGKVNITVTEDMTLTAEWKKLPSALVRIEIDANGGVGGSSSQTVEKGKTVTLEAPTKEGHLFTGWKDEKGNSYPAGADGKVNITVTEDMTLTAEWKKLPSALVRIEIDANGGVGGSGSQTVEKGKTVTLEAPTKEGHLFTGWKDEKGNSYPAGADGKVNITVNEDMKLTAVWEARTFTVTYVLLDGKTRTETVAYGQKLTLGEEPRTGYTFVGWKDGEKMYHAGETITVTEDMTLTAEWKKLPSALVRIEIDANGGVGGSGSQTVQKGETVTLEAPTKERHLFTGWKDEKGNSYPAGADGKVNITVTEDMTLTAEWEKLPSAENLPKTGDESPVLLWSAVLAVSAAAGFMLKRKK